MNRRRKLVLVLCANALTVPFGLRAQQPARPANKPRRIGVLAQAGWEVQYGQVKDGLRDLGYAEGGILTARAIAPYIGLAIDGTSSPNSCVCPVWSSRAALFGRKSGLAIARSTRKRGCSPMRSPRPFGRLDIVLMETPASRATSCIVAMPSLCGRLANVKVGLHTFSRIQVKPHRSKPHLSTTPSIAPLLMIDKLAQ